MNMENFALGRLGDVQVNLSVELGRTELTLKDVLALQQGSVVALNRLTDELLDVTANGKPIARAEVVAQNGRFALRVVERPQVACPMMILHHDGKLPPQTRHFAAAARPDDLGQLETGENGARALG